MIESHLQQCTFCCSSADTVLQLVRATCDSASMVSQTAGTAHRVDRAESGEVVFVGRVVAVPGDHVEGGEVLPRLKDPPAQLVQDRKGARAVLKACHRCLEISGGCQAICTCAGHLMISRLDQRLAVP